MTRKQYILHRPMETYWCTQYGSKLGFMDFKYRKDGKGPPSVTGVCFLDAENRHSLQRIHVFIAGSVRE